LEAVSVASRKRAIGPETRAFVERYQYAPRAMTFSPSAVLLFDRDDVDVDAAARAHPAVTLASVGLPTSLPESSARAWYWPEARERSAAFRKAVRAKLAAPAPHPVDEALLLTREVAGLARELSAAAVLWEPTDLLHEGVVFIDQAEDASREDLPLYSWVAFEGTKNEDGTLGMLTRGMSALGAMEIEVDASKQSGEQILECVTDVALFSLTGDAIPLDGETIDITRGSVRVRRMPSLRNDGSIALRVRV
jgi:hypothetical protein